MNFLVGSFYQKIFQNSYLHNRYQTVTNAGLNYFQRCTLFTHSEFVKKDIHFRKSLIKLHVEEVAPGRNYSLNFNLNFGNILKSTLKKFFNNNTALTKRGFLWYSTIEGVHYNEFFKLLEMPDTFYSWFKITELHVWMLLVRLMQDGENSRHIRSAVTTAMWEDVTKRAKKLAPDNKMFRKNFKELSSEFRTIIFAYDEGFLNDDKSLCNTLWYYFFNKCCDDPKKLEALVSYIRYQINQLQKIDTKGIAEKNISRDIWSPLKPHFFVQRQ